MSGLTTVTGTATIHQVPDDSWPRNLRCQRRFLSSQPSPGAKIYARGGGKMKSPDKKGTAPGFTPELGQRIAGAIEALGGITKAAKTLGRTKETLANWRDGVFKISLNDVTELAEAAGIDPAQLAFGSPSVNRDLDAVPIEAIRESWDFWMPVILRLKDRPDPETLREQFLADVQERAARGL